MEDLQTLFDEYKQNTNPTLVQQQASDPTYSVWLTASAGTGKTKVLIDRILRILLSGSEISSILAITYTSAAAFEMKDRIMNILQSWALKSDNEIKNDLINLYGIAFENKTFNEQQNIISLAKSLFARILDSPYGLRIETIHAFCQFILKKFPIEAGINPNFSLITRDSDITSILDKIFKVIITNRDKNISDILNVLSRYKPDNDLFKIVEAINSVGRNFNKLFSNYNINLDNFDKLLQPIFLEKYNVDKSIVLTDNYNNLVDEYIKYTKQELVKSFNDLHNLSLEICGKSSDPLYEKKIGKTPIEQAQKIISFIQKYKETLDFDITDYINLWKTNFNTKRLIKDIPISEKILQNLNDTTQKISSDIIQLKYLEYGYAITKFAYILIQKYHEQKQSQSTLDYDDLLVKTLQLLTKSSDYSAWVLYKLDHGINHILIDEAQDTTPEQWEIIDALSDGFFYSGVNKDNIKTIFVVGDYKQSIYSFQGANIDNFDYYHDKFEQKIKAHGFIFKNLNLDTSFRTSCPVLSFVNTMLLNKNISSGIISKRDTENNYIHKVAAKNFDLPGVVELWPVIAEESEKENYDYWNPRQVIFENILAKSKLAKLIANKIKVLVNQGVRLGDILILVGRRTDASILSYLVKKLIDAKIDIAGVDRIVLKNNIIICDLIALAQICISEYDDLNVASVLKSPFFGFNEGSVFNVCHGRDDKTVIQILSEKYPDVYQEFKTIQKVALSGVTPFDFFNFVLNRNDNLKKCYCRAGMETEEVIQEFLSLCILFEQSSDHYLGLPGFVGWIFQDDTTIKRSVEKNDDKLRIMTIHGAKGLQAKIVFLPDTLSGFNTSNNGNIKILFNENDKKDLLPYIKPANVKETDVYINVRDNYRTRQAEEKKRLLYVAITRAEEAVYICGYGNKTLTEDKLLYNGNIKNVYDMALSTFSKLSEKYTLEKVSDVMFDDINCIGSKDIIRLPKYVDNKLISASKQDINNYKDQMNFDRVIIPFKGIDDNRRCVGNKDDIYSPDVKDDIGILYGTLFHKLLEIIPVNYSETEKEKLKIVLTKFLQTVDFLNTKQKLELVNKLISGLNKQQIRNIILNPNSLNEVNIAGADGKIYRIDKLIIDEGTRTILIVDYKTNSGAEGKSKEYLDKYKNQLSTYKSIMTNIYPDYLIKTAILWIYDFSISMFDL